jgi:hypothetical protein
MNFGANPIDFAPTEQDPCFRSGAINISLLRSEADSLRGDEADFAPRDEADFAPHGRSGFHSARAKRISLRGDEGVSLRRSEMFIASEKQIRGGSGGAECAVFETTRTKVSLLRSEFDFSWFML